MRCLEATTGTMKKFFTFWRKGGEGESPSKGSLWKAVVAHRDEIPETAYTETCYDFLAKELRKIHLAACFSDAYKVSNILLKHPSRLNSKDQKSR